MKYSSYKINGSKSYGFWVDDSTIVDLPKLLGSKAPKNLDRFLEDLVDGDIDTSLLTENAEASIASSDVKLLQPIGRPGKIIGVAANNRMIQMLAHRRFDNPAFFFKPSSSLAGHGDAIEVGEDFGNTHCEPELAVIIGKPGKNISEAEALSHVFGYSIINDVTSPGLKARDSIELVIPGDGTAYNKLLDWRRNLTDEHDRSIYLTYHALSKGTDTFGPMGPWIVTADEVANPNCLAVNTYDGDTLVFEDSTANLTFSIEHIIAHLSKYMTLETGDIIHCGTAMKAVEGGKYSAIGEWDFSRIGGTCTIEIEGIGKLSNPIEIRK